jgi:hypothetical protein
VWLTAITAVLVPTFVALGYWQLTRALGGNTLSWAYVFEWPLFAGYLLHVWWRLLHEEPGDGAGAAETAVRGAPEQPSRPSDEPAGERAKAGERTEEEAEDEELAAYNRYLAALEESGRRKRW